MKNQELNHEGTKSRRDFRTSSAASCLRAFVVPMFFFLFTGCGGGVSQQYKPQGEVEKFDNKDWSTVLSKVVTADGFVKHDMIKNNDDNVRDALFRYVGLIGEVSPENKPSLFANDKEKLAYYLNAYNAICMYAVYKDGYPANLAKTLPPYKVYVIDSFPVGGKDMTLDTIEKQHVRNQGDPRVHFALDCMSHSQAILVRSARRAEEG
jgi:hypothetical protein